MGITWELIKKDFVLLHRQLWCYGLLMLCALAIMCIPNQAVTHFGTIVLIFAMVAFYCHLVMKAVVIEHKEKIHLFLITLPVSARQLMFTKVTATTLAFACIWAPALGLMWALSLFNPHWPAAAPAFHTLGFFTYLPAFALVLAAAATTRTEGLTILAFTLANMVVVLVLNFVPQTDFMQAAFSQGSIAKSGIIWPAQISHWVLIEIAVFLILLTVCYGTAIRTKSFLS